MLEVVVAEAMDRSGLQDTRCQGPFLGERLDRLGQGYQGRAAALGGEREARERQGIGRSQSNFFLDRHD